MKRSAGVTASAVVAILGSVVSILLGLLTAFGAIATRVAPESPRFPDQPVSPIPPVVMLAIVAIFYCGFGAWGIASAAGLLRLRNWARLCFVVFSGLLAFFSLCFAAGTAIAAFVTPPPDNVPRGLVMGVFVVFAAIGLACLGVAIWWLVYFNRSTIKAEFAGEAAASRPRQFPLAVTIIAWILITGGVISAVQMLVAYPLLILGFVLRGWAASLAMAFFAAVGLTAGIGLLKKRLDAHSLAVGYFGFGVLNATSLLLLPGSFARMQDIMQETQGSQVTLPANAINSLMAVGLFVGLVGGSAMVWLLIKSRKPFLDACRMHTE